MSKDHNSSSYHYDKNSSANLTIQQLTRTILQLPVPEQDPYELMRLCFLWLHTVRQTILQPLAAELTLPKIDAGQLVSIWDNKIESKIVSLFGPSAQADAPSAAKSKSCGPLVTVLMIEWKQKVLASQIQSITDLLETFTTPRLLDWYVKYAETFMPIGAIHFKHKTPQLVGGTLQCLFREMVTLLRASAGTKLIFTTAGCATDFVKICTDNNRLFVHMYDRIFHVHIPKGQAALAGNYAQHSKLSHQLEIASKQSATHVKIESWLAATYLQGSSQSKQVSSKPDANLKYRTCKHPKCGDFGGIDILGGAKFVTVRCSEGCITHYHSACWHEIETSLVENDDGIACTRSEDRGCKGWIVRARLRQDERILSYILGNEEADGGASPDANGDDDDDGGDEDEEDEHDAAIRIGQNPIASLKGDAVTNAAAVAGAAVGLTVCGRKFRNQKNNSYWATQPRARLRRVEIVNGMVAFDDQINRLEDDRIKAEKKRAAEVKRKEQEAKREEEKKKKEENEKNGITNTTPEPPKPVAISPTKASEAAAAEPPKKKVIGFEVVVPLVRKDPPPPPLQPTNKTKSPALAAKNSFATLSESEVKARSANGPTPQVASKSPSWPIQSSIVAKLSQPEPQVNNGFSSVITVKQSKSKSQQKAEVPKPPMEILSHGRTKEEIAESRRLRKEAKKLEREEAKRAEEATKQMEAELLAEPLVLEEGQGEEDMKMSQAREMKQKEDHATTDEEGEDDDGSISQPGSDHGELDDSEGSMEGEGQVNQSSASASSSNRSSPQLTPNAINYQDMKERIMNEIHRTLVASTNIPSATTAAGPVTQPTESTSSTSSVPSTTSSLMAAAYAAPSTLRAVSMPHTPSPSLPTMTTSTSSVMSKMAPPVNVTPPVTITPPTAATPATTTPQLQLLDDIATTSSTSPIILIYDLPTSVTVPMLGSIFCPYGRLRVHQVLTRQHGVVGVLQYNQESAAKKAFSEMAGRVYQLDTQVANSSVDSLSEVMDCEQWQLNSLVFGAFPLQPIPLPPTRVKFLGYQQGQPNKTSAAQMVRSTDTLYMAHE